MMPEPASPRLARRVGWIVAIGAVVLTLFAVAKHLSMGGLADSEISAGESEIARFISGEQGAADRAEAAFADAASVSPLDYYPAFGITVVRRLEALSNGTDAGEPGDPVLEAMLRADWDTARDEVDEMRDSDPKRAEYFDRLVESVRQSTNSE